MLSAALLAHVFEAFFGLGGLSSVGVVLDDFSEDALFHRFFSEAAENQRLTESGFRGQDTARVPWALHAALNLYVF